MEVEQYNPPFQVCQMPFDAMVVTQRKVYHPQLLGLQFHRSVLCLYDAFVFHALDRDVVQVLRTFGTGIIGVPARCNGTEHLVVVRVLGRIEDQTGLVADGNVLEEGKIAVSTHRLLEDIVS